VAVQFFRPGDIFVIDTEEIEYSALNPGETRFFKLRTPKMYSTDFRVTVDWVAWPGGREPGVTYPDNYDTTHRTRYLGLKDVQLDSCNKTPTSAKVCLFRVVVRSLVPGLEGEADVDIALFDSTGKLIDVILTQEGTTGTGRFEPLGSWRTTIYSGFVNINKSPGIEGMPGAWHLKLYTNQPVESMVDWKGGPW
jgi:hypothetical protein